MRGATAAEGTYAHALCISTHTPHAGRDNTFYMMDRDDDISTHTPHAGRDVLPLRLRHYLKISTHTPHAGRDG